MTFDSTAGDIAANHAYVDGLRSQLEAAAEEDDDIPEEMVQGLLAYRYHLMQNLALRSTCQWSWQRHCKPKKAGVGRPLRSK